jgi:hypothetical protein
VAREIIAAHGGEIAVADDPRAAPLCLITLPAAGAPQEHR